MRWLIKQILTIGIPLMVEHIHRRYKRAKAEQTAERANEARDPPPDDRSPRERLRDDWTRD